MNLRHTLLIARYSARYSVRGGIGLVFLLLSVTFGLMVAHFTLQSVEAGRQLIARELGGDDAQSREQMLRHVSNEVKRPVAWMLQRSEEPAAKAEAQQWANYLLEDRPAILSAIFLILLFGWPLVVSFGAFDLYSSDIGSRQLRYQLLRTDRGSIFFGRLLGMVFTFVAVLVLLGATVTTYIGLKVPVYGVGDLLVWSLWGTAAMLIVSLPYIALCAWISACCRSAFASLTVTSVVIGGVPLFALLGRLYHEAANYVQYVLPWGFQTRLFHFDVMQVGIAAGGCLVQTAVFLWLGHRTFVRRDL